MKMEVEIKTKVEHPEQNGAVHDHNSPEVNFGCSEPWFVGGRRRDGETRTTSLPAALGVLIEKSQTTSGMGVHPNDDGNKCIADLDLRSRHDRSRVTPLKWKLGVPGGTRQRHLLDARFARHRPGSCTNACSKCAVIRYT